MLRCRGRGPVVGLISLLLSSFLFAPSARAQQVLTGVVNETATIGSYTPGQFFTDPLGNSLAVGSVYTGQISGSPITGSFRFDGDFQRSAGSALGEFHGSFVAADAAGNTLYGTVAGTEVTDALGNATLTGRFDIEGGTGLFVQAEGTGQLSGLLDRTPLDPTLTWSVLTLAGTVSVRGPAPTGSAPVPPSQPGVTRIPPALVTIPATFVVPQTVDNEDNVRPGRGLGDRNHVHTGPPGQNQGQGRHGHD